MDIRKLQRAIVDGLEDVKGQNIVVFNTEHLSPLFERVIIASGTSNRQTKALASGVRAAVKSKGFPVMRTEGEENGEWIIVDCGAAVVHLMQPGIREYYHLEEIWGEKPVRMKITEGPVRLVKAGDGDRDRDHERGPSSRRAAAPARTAGAAPSGTGRSGSSRLAEQALAPRASGAGHAKPTATGAEPSNGAARGRKVAAQPSLTSAPRKTAPRKNASASGATAPAKHPAVAARKPAAKRAGASAPRGTVTRTVGVKGAAGANVSGGATGTAATTTSRKRAPASPLARKRATSV